MERVTCILGKSVRTHLSSKKNVTCNSFTERSKNMTRRIWLLPDPLDTFLIAYRDMRELRDCASREARDAVIPTEMSDHLERARRRLDARVAGLASAIQAFLDGVPTEDILPGNGRPPRLVMAPGRRLALSMILRSGRVR
jgi:hypothetical protein